MRGNGIWALLLAGCGHHGPSGVAPVQGATLDIEDVNNYDYSGAFTFDTVAVASGTDFCIDWSGLTTDLRGQAVGQVDEVSLLEASLSPQGVLDDAATNEISQSEALSVWLWPAESAVAAGETRACTTDFGIIGQPFDATDLAQSEHTWVVSLVDTAGGPQNILTSVFVVPTDGETNTEVALSDASATLTYTVDLASKPPVHTTASANGWTLDWSGVTTDVYGHPYDDLQGDTLSIAHYDFASVAEVESVFLQLDSAATETYALNVFGTTSANLLNAQAEDGTAFAGFTTDGIWLAAITCSQCTSPAPLILTVVEVGE